MFIVKQLGLVLVMLAAVVMSGTMTAGADEMDELLLENYQAPPNWYSPESEKLAPVVTPPAAPLAAPAIAASPASTIAVPASPLLAPTAPEPLPPGTGPELFKSGNYQAAYARFWPQLQAGDPVAAFYCLVIRRNGLDGRRPAGYPETAAIWKILVFNTDHMNEVNNRRQLTEEIRKIYGTALAHLIYFGPNPPSWPPPIFRDNDVDQRGRKAINLMAGAARDFTPAMNFTAYLYFHPSNNSHQTSFIPTLRAAEAGDYLAMGNLAWLYSKGYGTRKNNLRFAHWARLGCNSNPPVSRNQNEVGYAYEVGLGVTVDKNEAQRWYDKSAAQQYPPGQSNAARLKSKQSGTPSFPALDNTILF